MNPQLRELLDHSTFHKGSVRQVAALLPSSDEELDALIAEATNRGDQIAFILIATAAVDVGRAPDARHLEDGAALMGDVRRLGALAWKLPGDVPGALMRAVKQSRLSREMHAGALFVAGAWCREHRGGALPEDYPAEVRLLARVKELRAEALAYLLCVALTVKDEGIKAVLERNYPELTSAETRRKTRRVAFASIKLFAAPVMDLVPDEPPKVLAAGATMRRAVEKFGRNELCHCGSGKKYKRCCFAKDQERLHLSTEVAGKTHAELVTATDEGLNDARLERLAPFELARLDPAKIPEILQRNFVMRASAFKLFERVAEYFEVLDWNDERREEWEFALFHPMIEHRKDIAERLVAARARHEPVGDLRSGVQLLLAYGNPAEELRVLTETALAILRETDPDKLEKLGYGILCSRYSALGILVCRGLIPIVPTKSASFYLRQILEAHDRLNLPPDDPFSDILEKRLAEETHDEGKDAAGLRAARQRLDAKAAEVRQLKAEMERQRRELERREKKQAAPAQPAPEAARDEAGLRDLRNKLAEMKGTLNERYEERAALRRELEKARDSLEALRNAAAPAAPANGGAADNEDALFLPEQPVGNQPLRLIEFPHKFREALEDLPRNVARAALAMLGRLAGGEPAAFAGMLQLKACAGVFRQRIGIDHRLLFRLLPDRVQVVDLINRRDLDRRLKTLRAGV